MAKVQHYRQQAARCRELAADKPFSRHVDRWRAMANNYDMLADSLEKRLSRNLKEVLKRLEMQQ
jgi:hypothetical protein